MPHTLEIADRHIMVPFHQNVLIRRAPHDTSFKKWLNQLKTTLLRRTTTKYSFLDITFLQKGVPFFQAS